MLLLVFPLQANLKMLNLLKPSDALTQAKNRKESDAARALEIQKLVAQKYRELAKAEEDFNVSLGRNKGIWEHEEEKHSKRLGALFKEIADLEERKKAALVPLTTRATELDTMSRALLAREATLRDEEVAFEDRKISFELRLDEISERELKAQERSESLFLREEGIRRQAADIKLNSERLTAAIVEASADSVGRVNALDMRERGLTTKENNLKERERILAEEKNSLIKREIALKDKYETLERSISRVNKQHG